MPTPKNFNKEQLSRTPSIVFVLAIKLMDDEHCSKWFLTPNHLMSFLYHEMAQKGH